MTITINGSDVEVLVETVDDLLRERNVDCSRPGVAVAINDRVVRRSEWTSTPVSEGDRVEIITAMQGG